MQHRDPLNANPDPDQIAIRVRDSGIGVGIDRSRLDQIFPPFITSKLEERGIFLPAG